MTWRPTKYLLEGVLDNTTPGKVTGWMRFAGMKNKVTLDLRGDFHRDIRGRRIRFTNIYKGPQREAGDYMEGFVEHQTGKVENITAGFPPQDYTDYPYIEWYGDTNDRVVVAPEPNRIEVMEGGDSPPQPPRPKVRGKKLLTKALRRKLPPLYSQENKGGKAVVHLKCFTPDSSWTWWATEFDGEDLFFGLVEGHERELGYFSLRELESVRGPMGLPIERDLYWQPRTLEEIAPEMFRQPALGGG